MRRLIARLPVLYRSIQYRAGDTLPADNADMVQAWLDAGSAFWHEDDPEEKKLPKAKPVTAMPGRSGISSDGDPDALAGKVPNRPERERPKSTRRRK